ncbi:unnamed protein product [Effrenium voratum]|nr:unnamed protein product [Effrenium voratum]
MELEHFELEKAILAYRRRCPPKPCCKAVLCKTSAVRGGLRCVAISDTHMLHDSLEMPAGDGLIHCGDFTNDGTLEECRHFCSWAAALRFRHKLLVCGNHDLPLDDEWYLEHWQEWHREVQSPGEARDMLEAAGFQVLHGAVRIDGVQFYGSPLQPRQPKNRPQMAFGRRRGQELKEEWAKIPADVDVLLTHTPPAQRLDLASYEKRIGCEELAKALLRVAPAAHVFGHAHRGYGVQFSQKTCFINAATACDRRGGDGEINPPVVFEVVNP